MYLVDTNVLSAGAPRKAAAAADLVAWMDDHSARLYLSVVTVAEIEDGIAKARRTGATHKATDLAAWLATLLHLYSDRIHVFDVAVARVAGSLSDRARSKGHAPGFADIVIAATARHYDMTILTRTRKHFDHLDVAVLDPFAALPP